MLRVLTLSTLFPNAAQPVLGVFVERQALALAALKDVAVEVAAPIGLPPWPLSLHPHYRARAGLAREEEWKGLRVHRPRFPVLPMIGGAGAARRMAHALLPDLRALHRRFPFDVIDAEFFWPDGPAAMILAEALGVPFSIKARGADIHYWGNRPAVRAQMLAAAERAAGLLAVSESLKDDMAALGMPADKIGVHYTGVDLVRFAPRDRAAAKADLGLSGPLLVTAGALIPRKNQALVIEALPALPGATLLLVGDGPDRASLEALAGRTGVGDRVRFLGSLPHAELPRLLGAADAMVLPSASEGLANAWVEALACGTPIVVANAGGACELLAGTGAGAIVPRQPNAIATAVHRLLADPPDPATVRRAVERFSWERNAAELRDHLLRTAASAPPRSTSPRT